VPSIGAGEKMLAYDIAAMAATKEIVPPKPGDHVCNGLAGQLGLESFPLNSEHHLDIFGNRCRRPSF
jgi:hypothetical protein